MMNEENNEMAAASAVSGVAIGHRKTAKRKAVNRKKLAPKSQKPAASAKTEKKARTGKKAARQAAATSTESKSERILEMIGRPKGATLTEIMTATEWQAHSVRGFISTAGKKRNLKIDSSKNEAGDRVYRIRR